MGGGGWGGVTLSKVPGFGHGCFPRFLNGKNITKSRNASFPKNLSPFALVPSYSISTPGKLVLIFFTLRRNTSKNVLKALII